MWMVQRPHPTLSPFIVVVALVVAIHVLHANTPPPPHTHTPPSQLIILVNLFVHTLTHMCVSCITAGCAAFVGDAALHPPLPCSVRDPHEADAGAGQGVNNRQLCWRSQGLGIKQGLAPWVWGRGASHLLSDSKHMNTRICTCVPYSHACAFTIRTLS